jgi:hypothetical protein
MSTIPRDVRARLVSHLAVRSFLVGWGKVLFYPKTQNTALKYCSLGMNMGRPEACYANSSLIPTATIQSLIKGFSISIVYEGIAHARAAR